MSPDNETVNAHTVEQAMSILRREYWEHVHSLADDLRDAVKDGEVSNADEALEYVEQSVDGSRWVIYTYLNMRVLMFSDHENAAADELGPDGLVTDGNVHWAGMAYMALRADVLDALGDLADLFTSEDEDNEEDGD